jgi:arylsulfatase A-like enzyme
MRRTITCLTSLSAAIILAIPAMGADAARQGPPKNVILFGWDGAQRAHLKECLERGELPTIKKLSEEGALVNIDVVTGATDTKAGWTQILTGYNPAVTGVYSNGRYRDVPAGLSVFERLKEHFGPDKFVAVAVIGKSAHCGEIKPPYKKRLDEAGKPAAESKGEKPKAKARAKKAESGAAEKRRRKKAQAAQPGAAEKPKAGKPKTARPKAKTAAAKRAAGKIVEEGGVKYEVFGGSPYYTMHKACDVWDYGLVQNQKVGTRTIELLEKYKDKPFFFFVHFAEVDAKGHKFGENSKEYNDALISDDQWTGRIIEKLKELGLYDKTLVYVTADHGFNEGTKGHPYAPYVTLATNDPKVKRDGMRQDIAPTILARFGLDLSRLSPALDGEPLTQPATKPVLTAPATKPAKAKVPGAKKRARPGKKAA